MPFPKVNNIKDIWDRERLESEVTVNTQKIAMEESKAAIYAEEGIKYRIHTDFCERLKKMHFCERLKKMQLPK
jgi:hypothetical protein